MVATLPARSRGPELTAAEALREIERLQSRMEGLISGLSKDEAWKVHESLIPSELEDSTSLRSAARSLALRRVLAP